MNVFVEFVVDGEGRERLNEFIEKLETLDLPIFAVRYDLMERIDDELSEM